MCLRHYTLESVHSWNHKLCIWVGIGYAVSRRLLKQSTDPLQWARIAVEVGAEARRGNEVKDAQGRAVDTWP